MDSLDFILHRAAFEVRTNAAQEEKPKPKVGITNTYQSSVIGETAEVPLENIAKFRRHDLSFKMVVFMNMAYSVGMGFYNSADMQELQGRKALKIIDEWTGPYMWDLDTLNQKIARDEWASGNAFLNKVGTKEGRLDGLYMLPLSAFKRIKRDEFGTPLEFVYSWGQISNKDLPANQILHWPWLPEDEAAFGEGLGQPLARRGLGYETEAGNAIRRPSWFTQRERMQHNAQRLIDAGLPRFAAFLDPDKGGVGDITDELTSKLNKLDPLQHLVVGASGEISTISLDTSTKFDSFIRLLDNEVITGLMSPLPRLWSNLDFTYASAKEAMNALNPLIAIYQRAHKRLIEAQVYRPILQQEDIDYRKARVELNWGPAKKITMEDAEKLVNLLQNPMFEGKVDVEDLIDQISETAGVNLKPIADETKTSINDLRSFYNKAKAGKSITVEFPKNMSPYQQKLAKLLTSSRN